MLSPKSLRTKFILQLATGSAMLILIFSTMLYRYIRINIFENVVQVLNIEAINSIKNQKATGIYQIESLGHNNIEIKVVKNSENLAKPRYTKTTKDEKSFLSLEYPNGDEVVILKTDTTFYSSIISQIFVDIVIINVTMIFLILFYAIFISRSLLIPIMTLNKKLSKLNETVLTPIDESEIPNEFLPLSKGINRLIARIETFISYQKELFIGIAHELKTPLAVMKTKNEVTLLKERSSEKYIEALKNNNDSINSMNKMISSILEIGRQEGAHFEKGERKEMISFLTEMANNFKILAKNENKDIKISLRPAKFYMHIQPNLLLHVVQNFVQNAIKFSPENGVVEIRSCVSGDSFRIDVIDSGCGIDESVDLFAPFKRVGGKSGAGLGLFLAKGAAQAMNAEISIKNRNSKTSLDKSSNGETTINRAGTIATLKIPISDRDKNANKER